MAIKLLSLNPARWQRSEAYAHQVASRTVQSRSYYRDRDYYEGYAAGVRLLRETAVHRGIEVKTALVGGPGDSYEELKLLADHFPQLQLVHAADWHWPNINSLRERLSKHETELGGLEIALHFADLLQPFGVADGSLDLVYTNKLFDLYARDFSSTGTLLLRLFSMLRDGGMLYSFDYPLPGERCYFDEFAQTLGFTKTASRIYVKPFLVR